MTGNVQVIAKYGSDFFQSAALGLGKLLARDGRLVCVLPQKWDAARQDSTYEEVN